MHFTAALLIPLPVIALLTKPSLAETQSNKNQQPIRVLINDWTSQKVLATVTGSLFQSIGYQVEYVFSTTNEQWGSLSYGIDHVQIEVWQGTMSKMFNRVVKSGRVLDAGSHQATTREDWWYPSYVEQYCPGLPDWRALKKCASIFAPDSTANGSINNSKAPGHYIAGPWEKPEAARIRALDLNFKTKQVTEADELWAALKAAKAKQQPIVLFNWSPNWTEAVYKGKFVEFPEYHEDCENNPLWGINPQYHHDCGNPKNGWLKKAAWAGMAKQWPCAYQTLQNISFDNKTIALITSWVDYDKISYRQAATKWLSDNPSLWQQWIPTSCRPTQ